MFKWRRAPTSSLGSGSASRVIMIAFPTDFLSRSKHDITKEIRWIDAAPAGQATFVEGAFTYESRQTVEAAFQSSGQRQLLEFIGFPSGEAFFVASSFDQWDDKTLTVPGDGKVNDLVFSAADPDNSGRPIRIRFGPKPNDGDALLLQELGGYAVSQGCKP
jgi:hypothetical protein